MLKLRFQYFGHLMGSTDSSEKTLMLGKIEDRRRRGRQGMRWLDSITDSMDMTLSKLPRDSEGQGSLACGISTGSQRVRHDLVTEQQQPMSSCFRNRENVTFDSSVTPWTVACQVSLSTRFSRQEEWSGLPFPSPRDLPDPWIKHLLYCRWILYHWATREAQKPKYWTKSED